MVFLISGPDTLRARGKVAEITAKFTREVPYGAIMRVAGERILAHSVSQIFAAAPLLARRQLVIVSDLLAAKQVAIENSVVALLERQRELHDANVIVFFETEIPQTGPLVTWLKTHALCQSYPQLDSRQVATWVVAACKERGRAITNTAVALLVTGSGGDTWRLINEIEKVHAYLPLNAPISEDVVAILFTPNSEDKIFSMVDAAVRKDVANATRSLDHLLDDGVAAESIISLLEQQLRIALLLQADASGPALGGVHPFVLQKLLPIARRSSSEEMKNAYTALAEVDVSVKRGEIDAKTGLLRFVMRSSAKAS